MLSPYFFFKGIASQKLIYFVRGGLSSAYTNQTQRHIETLLISIANGEFETDHSAYQETRIGKDHSSSLTIEKIKNTPIGILMLALERFLSSQVLVSIQNNALFNDLYIFAVDTDDQALLNALLEYETRCYCNKNHTPFTEHSHLELATHKLNDFTGQTNRHLEMTDPINLLEIARDAAILKGIVAKKNNNSVKNLFQYSPSIITQALFTAITSKNDIITEYLLDESGIEIDVNKYHTSRSTSPYYLCAAMTHGTREATIMLLQRTRITDKVLESILNLSNQMELEKKLEAAHFIAQYGVAFSKKSSFTDYTYRSISSFINFDNHFYTLFEEDNPDIYQHVRGIPTKKAKRLQAELFLIKLDFINKLVSGCKTPSELKEKINDFAKHCVNKENDESLNRTRLFVFLILGKMKEMSTLPEVQKRLGDLIETLRNTYEGTFADKIAETIQEINNTIAKIPRKKRDKFFFTENKENLLKPRNLSSTLELIKDYFGNIPVKSEELMKSAIVITEVNESNNIINNNNIFN